MKGITPVVATLLLMGVTVGGIVTLYEVVDDTRSSTQKGAVADASSLTLIGCSRNSTALNVSLKSGKEAFNTSDVLFTIEGRERSSNATERVVEPFETFVVTFNASGIPSRPRVSIQQGDYIETERCLRVTEGNRNLRVDFRPDTSSRKFKIKGTYAPSSPEPIITGGATSAARTLDLKGNLEPEDVELNVSDYKFSPSKRKSEKKVSDGDSVSFPERTGLGKVNVSFVGESVNSSRNTSGDSDSSSTVDVGMDTVESANLTFVGTERKEKKNLSGTKSLGGGEAYYFIEKLDAGKGTGFDSGEGTTTTKVDSNGTYRYRQSWSAKGWDYYDFIEFGVTLSECNNGCSTIKQLDFDECDPDGYFGCDKYEWTESESTPQSGTITEYVNLSKGSRLKVFADEYSCIDQAWPDNDDYCDIILDQEPKGVEYWDTRREIDIDLPSRADAQDLELSFEPEKTDSLETKSLGADVSYFDEGLNGVDEKTDKLFIAPSDGYYNLEIPYYLEGRYDDITIYGSEVHYVGRGEVDISIDGKKVVDKNVDAWKNNPVDIISGTYSNDSVYLEKGDTVTGHVRAYDLGGEARIKTGEAAPQDPVSRITAEVGSQSKTINNIPNSGEFSMVFEDVPASIGQATVNSDGGLNLSYSFSYNKTIKTEDPKISFGGASADAVQVGGTLNEGQKVERSVNLQPGTSTLDFTSSTGTFNWSLNWSGKRLPRDPSLGSSLTHSGTLNDGQKVNAGTLDPRTTGSLSTNLNRGALMEVRKEYRNINSSGFEASADGNNVCGGKFNLSGQVQCPVTDSTVSDGKLDLSFSLDRGLINWSVGYTGRAQPEQATVDVENRQLYYPENFTENTAFIEAYVSGDIDTAVTANDVDGIPTRGSVDVTRMNER